MRNWTDNLISYVKSGEIGICPFCSSKNVKAENIDNTRQSLVFTCLDCNKSAHFDGLRTEHE